jgi:hypothetical protein
MMVQDGPYRAEDRARRSPPGLGEQGYQSETDMAVKTPPRAATARQRRIEAASPGIDLDSSFALGFTLT